MRTLSDTERRALMRRHEAAMRIRKTTDIPPWELLLLVVAPPAGSPLELLADEDETSRKEREESFASVPVAS